MPTIRTGAGAWAVQVLGGPEGAGIDSADAITGSFDTGPLGMPALPVPGLLESQIVRGSAVAMSGTGAGEGNATAALSREIAATGRAGAGEGGYRRNMMPPGSPTVTPGPTIIGGFEA